MNNFDLQDFDVDIINLIKKELNRQQQNIELIASENIVSKAVMEAQGSILTNKYAEGYPGKRYYGGCEFVDEIERIAIERVKKLFNCKFANVQPHSGSQANMAVMMSLLKPGDMFMGMDLNSGGHLTHGSKVSFSGKFYEVISYGVDKDTYLIDYNQVRELALKHRPKMIIAGGSSYSQIINFKIFKEIAEEIEAYLMVDMAHFAGLIAGGIYPTPVEYADVITSTTHKTLRGPRGGIILSNDEKIMKKINSNVFPGSQGGPLMHVIASKAVAFKEALEDNFSVYAKQIVLNGQAMCNVFEDNGMLPISGMTNSNLLLINVQEKGLNGNIVEKILDTVRITCNKNTIPFDTLPPNLSSGIRLGTAAITTRGFQEEDCQLVAKCIVDVISNIDIVSNSLNNSVLNTVKDKVTSLCEKFPIY